jgi:hypothetical protein
MVCLLCTKARLVSYDCSTAKGLSQLSVLKLEQGMQVDKNTNPIVGIEGRTGLLYNLSACLNNSQYFGEAPGRPGNMIGVHSGRHE